MRSSVLGSLIVLAASLLALPVAAAAAGRPASAAPVATAATVRLITGDSVSVRTAGGRQQLAVSMVNRRGLPGQYSTVRAGGDTYLIPGAARRYLDGILDRSLFDITELAKQPDTGRLPITLSLAAGAKPAVPGLTVTSRSGSSQTGYLTAAGARAFGQALTTQALTDARPGGATPASLFGGVTHISTAGAIVVAPAFQQYTLQLKVVDAAGKPAESALVSLINVDDGRKFNSFIDVVGGLAKVSVPSGNYSGLAGVFAVSASGGSEEYLIPIAQFAVTGNNQSMIYDARKATSTPSVHTPRPAGLVSETLEWDRIVGLSSLSMGFGSDEGTTVHVAPSGQSIFGEMEWVTNWSLAAAPATGNSYTYDLSFLDSGRVPANQNHTVADFQLSQIDARYYTDAQARSALFGRSPVYPFQFGVFTFLMPLATPRAQTEYVFAPTAARWLSTLISAATDDDPFQGAVLDGLRSYPSGSRHSVDWLRGPLAPGIDSQTNGEDAFYCGACRDSTNLVLSFVPYVDTTAGHYGIFDLPSEDSVGGRFQFYRNGSLIADEPNSTGFLLSVPSAKSTYRSVLTVNRGIAGFATSTTATEDLTFSSGASGGQSAPSGWLCPGDTACTVLPLLKAAVPLPTTLGDRLPIGPTTVNFTVGHIQGAAATAISGVSFAVSNNGGASYHSLPVTALGSGHYRVTVTNSSQDAGRGIAIRVGAADAAGGKLVETVQNAYQVARS